MLALEQELEWELDRTAEQMAQGDEVDVGGIPGADNRWYASAGQARKAALRRATQLGAGHRIVHDANPAIGQPHYHVVDANGQRVSGHFFYGRKPPRRILRGRPWREMESALAGRSARSVAAFEFELANAAAELEQPEPFYTKVTPIPGIGNKEGHEILTRAAMRGLPLSPGDRSAVLLGVIRPDRGGRSYWNFPRAALESLKAAAQPAHSLRPTPSSTVAAALRLIRARFAGLYLRAMRATSRKTALEWIGEALHLLQDSFSSAHVERVGGTGSIRYIRAFYIRIGWPPLSRAPHEHNAPSDTRDDVYLHGALRPEAVAAIRASRIFLAMALRHLRAPRSPRNRTELRLFMKRYLST